MTEGNEKIMEDDSIAVSATCVRIQFCQLTQNLFILRQKRLLRLMKSKRQSLISQVLFSKMMLPTKFILKQSMLLEVT